MVGLGFIAERHYGGFQTNPDARLTGLCNNFHGDAVQIGSQKVALEKKCRDWNLKPYASFEEMAVSPEIDALVIGSITPFHYDQIKIALNNGKHVLVEKPVVTQSGQIPELKQLSVETGGKIFPAHNFLYRDVIIKAKEAITAGEIGKIIHASFVTTHSISEAHATGWRSKKHLASGGALMDSGHHLVYQSIFLLGLPVKCQAFTSRLVLTGMECEDTAQVTLQYPDSSLAVIMQSWASNAGAGINGIRILGDKGNILITDALYVNGNRIAEDLGYLDTFKQQARAFSNHILHDVPPLSGLADVLSVLNITHAAYESAEQETVVALR